ncbi:MAG: prephenate dehydratase [Planctomycetota bacterium]
MSGLDELRAALDGVDRRLIEALARRQDLVREITALKAGSETPLRDRAREEEILTRLGDLGADAGLDRHFVTRIFHEVLEQSVRRQQEALVARDNPARGADHPLVVGYLGGEGSYSHQAATRHFGGAERDVEHRAGRSFAALVDLVVEGSADHAILPIENTTAGSIHEVYDLLRERDVVLVGEEVQRVDHCLLGVGAIDPSKVRRVLGHPQALTQCSRFLGRLQDCRTESVSDTATAARRVAEENDLSQAALANEVAATRYGLQVLARDVANEPENLTRFVVVAREALEFDPRIPCKTSIVFATRHEQGALVRVLRILADRGLNLTKIESRPRPGSPWKYVFYLDFEGRLGTAEVSGALAELEPLTENLKLLGSYPAKTVDEARPAEPRGS